MLAPYVAPSFRAVGLSIVTNRRFQGYGPAYFDIFDVTGVRRARARSRTEVERRMFGLLSPLVPDPSRARIFLDFRVALKSGRAVLVQPTVADSIHVVRSLERAGWSLVDSMIAEVDVDTGRVVLRGPLAETIELPAVDEVATVDAVLFAGGGATGDARLLSTLCQRHLKLEDGRSVYDAFDCLTRIAVGAKSFASENDAETARWVTRNLA